VAVETLRDRVVALTAQSPIHSAREREFALKMAGKLMVKHVFVQTEPLGLEDFVANTKRRCYYCKKHLFSRLWDRCREMGFATLAHGANLDDRGDYRPGFSAAIELNVAAPLLDAGMTKDDIRTLSRKRGLVTWDKPAMACLATRIPYDEPITQQHLQMVGDAEDLLADLGFWGMRVRWHGNTARIEAPMELMPKLLDARIRPLIVDGLQKLGFSFVTLDLQGYVQGSMNRLLADTKLS